MVRIAERLTDKQKKKMVVDYLECGNYSEVARKHGVSVDTVRRYAHEDKDFVRKSQEKKKENEKDILEYMDSKKELVCTFIDTYMDEMLKPEKLERATVNQLSTALGTVIDKFTMSKNGMSLEIEDLSTLKDLLK